MLNGLLKHLLHKNVFIVFVIGVVTLCGVIWQVSINNQKKLEMALNTHLEEIAYNVIERINLYQYGLRGARGVLTTLGYEEATRKSFAKYSKTRDIQTEFPGARGFGYIQRVPFLNEQSFIQLIRETDKPDFDIRFITPHKNERFVILFIEPEEQNKEAIGLDIASETNRRNAALESMQAGEPRLTAPISLVQASGEPSQSFLLLMPVMLNYLPTSTAQEREKATVGWVYTALQMDKVMVGLNINVSEIHVSLRDVTDAKDSADFYISSPHHADDVFSHKVEKQIFGRLWQIKLDVTPAYVHQLNLSSPRLVIVIGSILTLLLMLITMSFNRNQSVEKRIQQEQARLATIVRSSDDAIISQNLVGLVTSWNEGATRMFGYQIDEVIGYTLEELIVPLDLWPEEQRMLSGISKGHLISHFETERLHKNGKLINVSVTLSPMRNESGLIIGASKTIRDITQQKKQQAHILELNSALEQQISQRTKELSDTNILLRNLLNAASDVAIVAVDFQGIIQLFNSGAENITGYQAEELVGLHTPAIYHLESEVIARAKELSIETGREISGFDVFAYKLKEEGGEEGEWTFVKKDGKHLRVSLMTTIIKNEQGHITGYLGIAIDQTERILAERALASSLENTRAILDTATNPIITIDCKGCIRSINPEGEKEFGYSREEIIGQNVKLLMPEPYQSEHDAYLRRYAQEGNASIIGKGREGEAKRKDGSHFPIHLSVGEMRVGGEPMFVGLITNITTLRQKQNELERAHRQINLATDIAELGVWSLTLADNSLQWNDRMFVLYDYPLSSAAPDLRFHDWHERIHPDDIEKVQQRLANLSSKSKTDVIFRVIHRNGQIKYLQGAAQIERDKSGKVVSLIGINRDITDQIKIETTLQEAKDKADAASAAKSAFLANMSHEIRTPMNAVLGLLQLVQKSELNDYQRDYISKAHSAADSLLGLLNDILDYSKIEAGKLELDCHEFSIEELMQKLAIVLSGNQHSENTEIILHFPLNLPLQVRGDAFRLQQILINLAGNALKFTKNGHVNVYVNAESIENNQLTLRFGVVDTGIGISAEQRGKIFDGFSQAEASISRRFGGTGLGLVISNRLLKLMNSQLELFSEVGKGSQFWFDVKLELLSHEIIKSQYPAFEKDLKLLIITELQIAANSLQQTLADFGCQTQVADDAESAISLADKAILAKTPFDVFLIDMSANSSDCLQFFFDIQRLTKFRQQAKPRVIFIADQQQQSVLRDKAESESIVFDAIFSKPVMPRSLYEGLAKLMFDDSAQINLAPPIGETQLKGLRILVVDDNEINRVVATQLLSSEEAIVDEADSGLSAVNKVLHSNTVYDVVLMDMQMPDIDGLEATRTIRQDNKFVELPIIAMTANVSESDKAMCEQAGMNNHIGKPFQLADLVAIILFELDKKNSAQ